MRPEQSSEVEVKLDYVVEVTVEVIVEVVVGSFESGTSSSSFNLHTSSSVQQTA